MLMGFSIWWYSIEFGKGHAVGLERIQDFGGYLSDFKF